MKYLILTVTFIFFVSCKSLTNTKVVKSEPTPHFQNQGEQEDYWAKRLFEEKYEKLEYSKFNGEIKITDFEIQFGATQCIIYPNPNPEYNLIFEKGLLYPEIVLFGKGNPDIKGKRYNKENEQLYSDTLKIVPQTICLKIDFLEELTFLSDTPKIKRFRAWIKEKIGDQYLSFNSNVYFFEITNETANEETEWKIFMENAKVTFVAEGWTVI